MSASQRSAADNTPSRPDAEVLTSGQLAARTGLSASTVRRLARGAMHQDGPVRFELCHLEVLGWRDHALHNAPWRFHVVGPAVTRRREDPFADNIIDISQARMHVLRTTVATRAGDGER
ncbi:MAG: hypothetical protein U5Q44_07110 [Dehalococcoidia bacterium]|nr:hypothetical protein [Dehalococcoidia bacterium]